MVPPLMECFSLTNNQQRKTSVKDVINELGENIIEVFLFPNRKVNRKCKKFRSTDTNISQDIDTESKICTRLSAELQVLNKTT